MQLTRHQAGGCAAWAVDGYLLPRALTLSALLGMRREGMMRALEEAPRDEPAKGELLPPVDPLQEVWAAGVTYLRSREARRAESQVADVYERVYDAPRPELFFKATGWRVAGHGMPIRVRADSRWNVPEPELVAVINRCGEIVGYCAGNDVSSRDIEGENPLYLPQAKVYTGSCALGPGIELCGAGEIGDVPIRLRIERAGVVAFAGEASTAMMKRKVAELAAYLTRELDFPYGVLLMTGTCIVPGADFTLRAGDVVGVEVGSLAIENPVA